MTAVVDTVQNPVSVTSGVTFAPSAYDPDLTMDGTAQTGALATGAKKLYVGNLGATTEAIRVAFGESSAAAAANLTIVTGAATTGHYIPAQADNQYASFQILKVSGTHYAVANAVALDTQTVTITQGV